jgi:hypothetical protein
MSTRKQINTAKIALENPTMEKKTLVALGGYGRSIQKTPSKVLESVGFKEALAEFGLTEEFITTALVSDIKNKPKRRVRELELGSDILGMRKREFPSENKSTVVAVQVIINARDNIEDRTNTETIICA